MPTVNELLDKSKAELSDLLSRELFLLRDLFKRYEWNRISHSDRLFFGTLFLNYIKTDDIGGVPIEKTSSGQQQIYKNHSGLNMFERRGTNGKC